MDERSKAAVRIQSYWRGYRTRCQVFATLVPKASLLCTSKASRSQSQALQDLPYGYLTSEKAALVIQRAWRRHIDVQVFQYYKDLINFESKGKPSLMLRCINPKEARLLDAASGTHVKFRLAGDKFPPNIYYKIFTHRPIQDLGAYAPRDYTDMGCRQPLARYVHNRGQGQPFDKSGWYRRWENNGWRLVSDRLLHLASTDPITLDTSRKREIFKPIRAERKEDLERRKRRRKAEWMRKLYSSHLATESDTTTAALGSDEGIDALLNWTASLDYFGYVSDWQAFATTAGSESHVVAAAAAAMSSCTPTSN